MGITKSIKSEVQTQAEVLILLQQNSHTQLGIATRCANLAI